MRILQFHIPEDQKILTTVSESVNLQEDITKDLAHYKNEMIKLCSKSNTVWIASNQIWILKRFFLIKTKDHEEFYINPILIKWVWEVQSIEWCMSITQGPRTKQVKRFKKVYIEFTSLDDGYRYKQTLEWLNALVFQHELDHLNWITI